MTRHCVFCQIHAGQAPATVRYRWRGRSDIAIVPLDPVTEGHLLIIPVDHVTDPVASHATVGRSMGRAAWLAGHEGYDSFNIIMSYGVAATQTMDHLHIHLVPRRVMDNLALPWDRGRGEVSD